MMVRDHLTCLFAAAPIADCGRDMRIPEPVLASSWPLAVMFAAIILLCGYAYVRSIYHTEIDWEQEPLPKAPLRHPEDVARDAGA